MTYYTKELHCSAHFGGFIMAKYNQGNNHSLKEVILFEVIIF
jgi:hypothetical protein